MTAYDRGPPADMSQAGQYRMRCRDSHFRMLVGVNEGLAHATGAAPLFTSAVSAFLAFGPAQP